jgi:hypothetical protein
MHTITKRLMEFFIVFVIIAAVYLTHKQHEKAEDLYQKSFKYRAKINRIIHEKHGPGSRQAYQTFFNQFKDSKAYDLTQLLRDHKDMVYSYHGAPAPYQTMVQAVVDQVDDIKTLIQKGPYIYAPDDPGFSDYTHPEKIDATWSNFSLPMQSLRQAIYALWVQGKYEEAIDAVHTGLQYCNQFRYSYEGFFIAIGHKAEFIDVFHDILWLNPSPQANKLVYRFLQTLEPEGLFTFTQQTYLLKLYSKEGYGRVFGYGKPGDYYSAIELLTGHEPDREDTAYRILREHHLVPAQHYSVNTLMNLPNKWTTLPAMRKRARNLPAAIYRFDPLFTPEQAQQIPPLDYAAHAYIQGFHTQFAQRVKQAQSLKTKALTACYWVRVFHDTHNRWPTQEEMLAQCPYSNLFKMNFFRHPDLMIDHFRELLHFDMYQRESGYTDGLKNIPFEILLRTRYEVFKSNTQVAQMTYAEFGLWFLDTLDLYEFVEIPHALYQTFTTQSAGTQSSDQEGNDTLPDRFQIELNFSRQPVFLENISEIELPKTHHSQREAPNVLLIGWEKNEPTASQD